MFIQCHNDKCALVMNMAMSSVLGLSLFRDNEFVALIVP